MKYFVMEDSPGVIVAVMRETTEEPYYERWDVPTQTWVYDSVPFGRMWAGDPDFRSSTATEVQAFIDARRAA